MTIPEANSNTKEYRAEQAACEHDRMDDIAAKYGCSLYTPVPDYIGQWPSLEVSQHDEGHKLHYVEDSFEQNLIGAQLDTVVGRIVEHCPANLALEIACVLGDFRNTLVKKGLPTEAGA